MDPRRQEFKETWWEGEESTPNSQAAEISRDHFLWLLQFHGVNLRTARILELWTGQWYLLHAIRKTWVDISGFDQRPRPFREDIEIKKGDISQLSSIFAPDFYTAIISRDVLDERYYNQDIIKIAQEISTVLWKKWIYIAKEPNTPNLQIPDTIRWVIEWQFQIFRKRWYIADKYDFSRKYIV